MKDLFIRKADKAEAIRMHQNEENGVVYLSFPVLEQIPFIRHGFSTRIGGVSKGIYAQMNLSFQRGDKQEAVAENYRRFAQALQVNPEDIVCSAQTHTANIRLVTEQDKGKGYSRPLDYQDVDALITNQPNVVLMTFYADCVPVYLVDPVEKAIGLCHSGWRGTVAKISQRTIKEMKKQFGSKPENILAAVGPSICKDCYEVSKEVIDAFKTVMQPGQMGMIAEQRNNGRYCLDLWKANQIILEDSGVLPSHIQVTDICTCCNEKVLFSHRASHGMRGNLAALLSLIDL